MSSSDSNHHRSSRVEMPISSTGEQQQGLAPHHEHEDPQVAQDIDAARQMSRARGGSTADHRGSLSPSTSPQAIPSSGGRRPSVRARDDPSVPPSREYQQSPAQGRGLSGSYMGRSPMASRSQHQAAVAAASARFYNQQRRGSNASLDSASHFIDHRDQHHSMSASVSNANQPSFPRRTSRLSGTPQVEESAVADDYMAADVRELDRNRSQGRGSQEEGRDGDYQSHTPHTLSRRPSEAQDDVWLPHGAQDQQQQSQHQHPPHSEFGGEEYPDDHRDYEEMPDDLVEASRNANGNLPPGFPFTFDMRALESYADEERTKIADDAGAIGFSNGGLRNRHRMANESAYGISPESDDATFYSRRPKKLGQVDGSQPPQGQARYQRKLALFESGGTGPPPHDLFGRGQDVNTPLLGGDGNPASPSDLPSYQPGGSGDKSGRMGSRSNSTPAGPSFPGRRKRKGTASAFSLGAGGLGAPTPADKPYRFTFYSNALPSTIHARHLAELPAKGQSFEELFLGLDAGSLGGHAEPQGEAQVESPGEPVAAEGGATDSSGKASSVKPDPSQVGSNPATSALSAQLAARGGLTALTSGRKEGTTAPPTRTGTPVPGSARNSTSTARGASAGPARGNTGISTMPNAARTAPGGGIRMDQDPEANTWWLDVLSPTDQEMKLLSRVFGIHPLTTEDILMEETREKIELFRNYYLVCFRSFDQDPYSPTYLEPLNMYIIVFREGTLSFHFRATPHPQNVRRRIKQLKDYINVTSDWISYALIDDITDAFGPLIQSIEYEVDSIDELVLILKDVEQSDMLRRIGACRKKVMGLLRLMGNKADVVKGLAKRCNENWSVAPKSDIGLYLSDIQDHLITMTQNLSHFEKLLSRSHSNYLAQISIEMTEANNRANDVLSKLTALGTVIVPLNVITGLWGMNVNVPGQGVENLHWFGGLVGSMIFIAGAGYWLALRYLK